MPKTWTFALLTSALALITTGILVIRSSAAGETSLSNLAQKTHFHGIAVDPRDAGPLYLATHHGVFVVSPDGTARRVSESSDDFMGFTPHPADPNVLYASGHPSRGGNLGFIVSRDGGKTWSKLADGAGGPVDFHQMDVSKADPSVIYGVYGDLQKSTDCGRSWTRVGPAPNGIISLATSSVDVDKIYAATRNGLMLSGDGGRSWRPASKEGQLVTMVHVARDGAIYAFSPETGLSFARESDLVWQPLGGTFGNAVVLHLAVGAGKFNSVLYAITFHLESRSQSLHVSRDAGKTWNLLGQ